MMKCNKIEFINHSVCQENCETRRFKFCGKFREKARERERERERETIKKIVRKVRWPGESYKIGSWPTMKVMCPL